MFPDDDGDWPLWDSWAHPGLQAHPDAPFGGGGPGSFSSAQPLGLSGSPPDAHDSRTPWDPHDDPGATTFEAVRQALLSPLRRLARATHLDEIATISSSTLGRYSFGLGVCFGLAESALQDGLALLELQKMFILADLHDQMHGRVSFLAGGPFSQLGAVFLALGMLETQQLDEAHTQREALKEQLGQVLTHPLDYLGTLPPRWKREYLEKWNRFGALMEKSDLGSQFEAGQIFGRLLMEVVSIVLDIAHGVSLVAKLARKAPELAKLLGSLKGSRARAAGEAPSSVPAPAPKLKSPTAKPQSAEPPRPFKTPAESELRAVEVNGIKALDYRKGSNGKVAVIGRDMKLVEPYAAELRNRRYDVETFSGKTVPHGVEAAWLEDIRNKRANFGPDARLDEKEMMSSKMFTANQEWAQKLKSEGYTVVDLGAPPNSTDSPFYKMEKHLLFEGK